MNTSLWPVWPLVVTFLVGSAQVARADIFTLFGQDLPQLVLGSNGLPVDYLPRVGQPNADAAAAQFTALVGAVGTETFEDDAVGSRGPLDFGNGVTATVTPGLFYAEVADQSDRALGAHSFLGMSVPFAFTWTFSEPLSAFGFYGFALNGSDGQVALDTTLADGSVHNFGVPGYEGWNRTIDDGIAKQSLSFFGLVATSPGEMISSVTVRQGRAASNHLYFDNISASTQRVPEPSTLLLLGLPCGWLFLRRRLSSQQTPA